MAPSLLLCACTAAQAPSASRDRYLRALALSATDGEAAWTMCRGIADRQLSADCGLAALEALARGDQPASAELLSRCRELKEGWASEECAFQVGELRDEPAGCAQAGRFADDCRLHLLSTRLSSWLPRDAHPADGALHERLLAEARRVGLAADDMRPWSAWFRWVLGQQRPLDRGSCLALEGELRQACWNTGRALYQDRLNRARDQGSYPCPAEQSGQRAPLPAALRHGADAELDQLRLEREAADLCPLAGGAP